MTETEFLALERCRIKAATACGEYERWASEVRRLTGAIAGEECRKMMRASWDKPGSCFAKAKVELCGGDFGDRNDPDRPLSLYEIEKTVADCESCTRLVGFIRARKEAKKQYGIAKRRVRHVGKKVIAALKAVGEIE